MPITFKKKQDLVEELKKKIADSKSIVFADFTGLASGAMSDLRKKLRKEKISFKVVKKTLLKRTFQALKLDDAAASNIPGQLSIAVSEDELSAAKALSAFIKESKTENLTILGGILENKLLTKEEVINLSKIPGKEELLGQLVGTLKSPMSGLVNTMSGNIRNLVFVLKQISNKEV